MAIRLTKGGAINLRKENQETMDFIKVGLGWDKGLKSKEKGFFGKIKEVVNHNVSIDIDGSVNLYDRDKVCVAHCDYTNLRVYNKDKVLVKHSGDERSGSKKGDDEIIFIDLNNLKETNITSAVVVLNIYSPKVSFESIINPYINIYDKNDNLLVEYKLDGDNYSESNGMIVGTITRKDNDWEFKAVGEGIITAGLSNLRMLGKNYI